MARLSVDESAGEATAGSDGSSAGTNAAAGSSHGDAGANDGSSAGSEGAGGSSTDGGSPTGGVATAGASLGGAPGGGSSQGGTSAGRGSQAGRSSGGGGAGNEPEPCADPVSCIDEVASAPSDFGNPGWKDSWWVTGCSSKQSFECLTRVGAGCPTAGATPEEMGSRTVETWRLGGEKGQHYKVTFKFNGVTEGKSFTGGLRDAVGPTSNINSGGPYDMFYRDGTSSNSLYETLKLTIFDDKGIEARHFYMNAGDGPAWEQHATFLASYQKSIVVVGQGRVEHLVQDKNCRVVDNCGAANLVDANCPEPRKLPGDDANLMLPPKYKDSADETVKDTSLLAAGYPGATRTQPWHAHASHLKIVAIEKTSDEVTKNY